MHSLCNKPVIFQYQERVGIASCLFVFLEGIQYDKGWYPVLRVAHNMRNMSLMHLDNVLVICRLTIVLSHLTLRWHSGKNRDSSQYKDYSPGKGMPIIKIIQLLDCLIFIMGISKMLTGLSYVVSIFMAWFIIIYSGILLFGPLGTNLSQILLMEFYTFSFKKMHFRMSSGKYWPFCPSLNVLRCILL